MTTPSKLQNTPDLSVSSAAHVACDPEFKPMDRQAGWLVVNRWTYRVLRVLTSKMLPKPDLTGVRVTSEPDAGPGGLMVTPEVRKGNGAVIFIHGGGYVIGNPKEILAYAITYARTLGVPVLCPGYELGPEKPFPSGHSTLLNVWHWLQSHAADRHIDPQKIAIAGQSAGGGMAAALVQRLRDDAAHMPAAQVLIYPMLDDATATRRALDHPRHRVWSNKNNLFGWSGYLGRAPGKSAAPYAVPAHCKDLSHMPPAWIGVGTSDLFLDEDRDYAARLTEQGCAVTYIEVPGAIHAFELGNTPTGRAFIASQMDFLLPYVS